MIIPPHHFAMEFHLDVIRKKRPQYRTMLERHGIVLDEVEAGKALEAQVSLLYWELVRREGIEQLTDAPRHVFTMGHQQGRALRAMICFTQAIAYQQLPLPDISLAFIEQGTPAINALYQENAQADAPLVLSYTVGNDTHVITVDEAQHEYDQQQSISHAALRCVVALVRQLFTATGESP